MAHLRKEGTVVYPASGRVLILGVCGMEKKVDSQPMKDILERLKHPNIKIIVFAESMILTDPIEEWPRCDCLLAFFSMGFPLEKAVAYSKLREPFLINDLESQYDLLNRRTIYKRLEEAGVPVPKHAVLHRNRAIKVADCTWDEQEDTITVGSKVFHKPFVEKPLSAEDHNIHIYFPSSVGGGSQQLFRKVKNCSSKYSANSTIRKTGSYIYEEFLATDGTDVKVYTVGPDYAHAEARKSPGLDGKVLRDNTGKEKRLPIILNSNEKLIARQVCIAFNQTLCGFDLLRDGKRSYVCDVNGFSFVKNSPKYYDDCAQILKEMIISKLAPELFPSIQPSLEYLAEDVPVPIPSPNSGLELQCVIAVMRHGDRTPKQKLKMVVTHYQFIQLFERYDVKRKLKITLKSPTELQDVLGVAGDVLEEVQSDPSSFSDAMEVIRKLKQTKEVLVKYGHTSGVNRSKVQFKSIKSPNPNEKVLLMILKWGGELTPAGRQQAEELGKVFRCIYPGGAGEYGSLPGSGFLRLHNTYRHDLKVYASDEGRVQMTAAAFVKGLLDLEGSLAPILFHMVKKDVDKLLDNAFVAEETMIRVKRRLHEYMKTNASCLESEELRRKLNPTEGASYKVALDAIRNPVDACEELYEKIVILTKQISELGEAESKENLYLSESYELMLARWIKLEKDFKRKDGKFDISKIPDIYDCIKYDMLHNSHLGLKVAHDLYIQSMHLADLVMPQEYGITREEKLEIAEDICCPLLHKIQLDISNTISNTDSDIMHQLNQKYLLGMAHPRRHVRTRIYFTSESNIHALHNMLRFGILSTLNIHDWMNARAILDSTPELNYMTQFVFLLFENGQVPVDSEDRYKIEIHFSPGAKGREEIISAGGSVSSLGLDFKKSVFPLKRQLPDEDRLLRKSSTFSMQSGTTTKMKRQTQSLPMLMDPEQLQSFQKKLSTSRLSDKDTGDIWDIPENVSIASGSILSIDSVDSTLNDFTIGGLINTDLATSVEPLKHLCTIPLAKMQQFLSNAVDEPLLKEHRTSASSIYSHRSSTGSMIID